MSAFNPTRVLGGQRSERFLKPGDSELCCGLVSEDVKPKPERERQKANFAMADNEKPTTEQRAAKCAHRHVPGDCTVYCTMPTSEQ
jgi:hypothetical protein